MLLVSLLSVTSWGFTLYRVHTGEFEGRYTKRRWLLSVMCTAGVVAYWLTGESARKPRTPHSGNSQ
jgi:hypothetical protein